MSCNYGNLLVKPQCTHYYNPAWPWITRTLLQNIKNDDLNGVESIFKRYSKPQMNSYWKMDNFDFLSPIHEAAECGHNDILKYLLSPSIGFDINELTSHGSHILHLAAYRGKVSTVKLLINEYGVSPETKTADSECTALILASRNGHEDVVRLLIETYGADINVCDYCGSTALHKASGWNQLHIIRYLVCDIAADLEIKRDHDGYTPLMLAVYYNKWESVNLLLDLGSNIENVSFDGSTAAHIAMERNNYKSLYYLLCRGADIDRLCKQCSVRNMADYGTFELKQCINDGLSEYHQYYEQTAMELSKVLRVQSFCDDVIQSILEMTYPTPILCQDSNTNVKTNRKRSIDVIVTLTETDQIETYAPPNKKQRLD